MRVMHGLIVHNACWDKYFCMNPRFRSWYLTHFDMLDTRTVRNSLFQSVRRLSTVEHFCKTKLTFAKFFVLIILAVLHPITTPIIRYTNTVPTLEFIRRATFEDMKSKSVVCCLIISRHGALKCELPRLTYSYWKSQEMKSTKDTIYETTHNVRLVVNYF